MRAGIVHCWACRPHVEQKGSSDAAVLQGTARYPVANVILGTGEYGYEQALQALAAERARRDGCRLAYNEGLATELKRSGHILMPRCLTVRTQPVVQFCAMARYHVVRAVGAWSIR